MKTIKINSLIELNNALQGKEPLHLIIQTSILSPTSIILPNDFKISGITKENCILNFNNGDGIGLTSNNTISNLTILCNPNNRAVFLLSNQENLGNFVLKNISVSGQIQLLTRAGTLKTNIKAEDVHITTCDARRYSEQPQKYGVNVYQGAFTIYNYNSDPKSVIQTTLSNISIGSKGSPVTGSGLFISGFGDKGGFVIANTITTGEIHSNSMIPFGQPNMITAAVFIVYGAKIKNLTHKGSITTYGVNDMVLDTWGEVKNWTAEKPITSYGPSGIGFVNFGKVEAFETKDKIETFGLGARGFNQYDGTVKKAIFHSIITHGNGSIGIQVSKPVGKIEVKNNIETNGSQGKTLVKGEIFVLAADGISVKEGGEIKQLTVNGNIKTNGKNVSSYSIAGGVVKDFSVLKEIIANGENSNAVSVEKGETPLANINAISRKGIAVKINKNSLITSREGLIAKGSKGDIIEE